MRRIKRIVDIVDWDLCIGCGACYYACQKGAVSMVDFEEKGIRPEFKMNICERCNECLSICPGYFVDAGLMLEVKTKLRRENLLLGNTLEIWEGHATDKEIRYHASSGGALSAIALYCLEQENMKFVLHTGMNPSQPWTNITVQSKSKDDLLKYSGSRYAPSSPCDGLDLIEQSDGPCVFIGKPCDTAAVSLLRKQRPRLDANLGLVLTFFCAGPPCTKGTLELISQLGINLDEVNELRYRGNGWPGNFKIFYSNKMKEKSLTYKESWGKLSKHHRSFRCHLCPDGLGELADISCGDAWHRYANEEDIGQSLVLVRSKRGKEILHRAGTAAYLDLMPSGPSEVIAAQGLVKRRSETFGRLMAMQMLLIPTPRFNGFYLFNAWLRTTTLLQKVRTILGTLRRLLQRGLWHRNPVFTRYNNK